MLINIHTNNVKTLVVSVGVFAVVFLFFQLFLPGHLYWWEQCQLFIYSGEYVASHIDKPASLLSFISDFITQFFYLRYAGAAIIALLVTVEYLLFCAIFKLFKGAYFALYALIPTIVFTALWGYNYIDLKREKYLYIDTQYYFGNHQNVLKALHEMNDVNNRYISYYANLESARRGTLSDDLLQHYQSFETLFIIPNPKINWHSMLIGYEAYALTGCTNMAQHAAMLGNTFSPSKHNVRAIEYLAEINLSCGDTLAAKKYTRLLSKTLFHKQLRNRNIPHVIHKTDTILSPNDIIAQLKIVADENFTLAAGAPYNQITIDYLLCYQLLTKNLFGFFESIQKYHPHHYGRYYKEAMLIVASINRLNLNELGIERDMIESFFDYEKHYKAGQKDYLRNKYSDTYWYYYHFAGNE